MTYPYERSTRKEKVANLVIIVTIGLVIFALYELLEYLPQILWWASTPLTKLMGGE